MTRPGDPRVALFADLADQTRFDVLMRLERGPASATQLAQELEVSPTQLANHLRRLRDAGLVSVSRRGRLAIYELAEPGLRDIFSMVNGLRGAAREPSPSGREAGTCYDHLAGRLGVALLDHLIDAGAIRPRDGEGQLELGPNAEEAFAALGVDRLDHRTRRMPAYACLDSGIGRAHLGGELGARLATTLRRRRWVSETDRPRELVLTEEGRRQLARICPGRGWQQNSVG